MDTRKTLGASHDWLFCHCEQCGQNRIGKRMAQYDTAMRLQQLKEENERLKREVEERLLEEENNRLRQFLTRPRGLTI